MTREERLLDVLKQKEKTLPAVVQGVVQEVGEQHCSVKLTSDLILKAVRYKINRRRCRWSSHHT